MKTWMPATDRTKNNSQPIQTNPNKAIKVTRLPTFVNIAASALATVRTRERPANIVFLVRPWFDVRLGLAATEKLMSNPPHAYRVLQALGPNLDPATELGI
jgi:hypothetical protein